MRHAAFVDSTSTSSMLDMLMARWQATPPPARPSPPSPADALERARDIVIQTLGHYVKHLEAADQALYATLVSLADIDELRGLFFQCFDLMARVRGPAIAVLHVHELYRLMR